MLFREPIHLNLSNKGKLHKLQKHSLLKDMNVSNFSQGKGITQRQRQKLLLTPREIVVPNKNQTRHKHSFHFCMKHTSPFFYINRNPQETFHNNNQYHYNKSTKSQKKTVQSGSFRAIHTANNEDLLKGFPLRSVTAVRPFRRGIRAVDKVMNKNNTIEITELACDKLASNHFNLSCERFREKGQFQERQQLGLYNQFRSKNIEDSNNQEQEDYEQFYKYKHNVPQNPVHANATLNINSIPNTTNAVNKLAKTSNILQGVRILPFKKYKIRDIPMKNNPDTIDNKNSNKYDICRF